MHADTAAIQNTGSILARTADDLIHVANALPGVVDSAPVLFGPVAEDLMVALRQAVTESTRAVADLADRLAAAGTVAVGNATSYADTEQHVGQSISTLQG